MFIFDFRFDLLFLVRDSVCGLENWGYISEVFICFRLTCPALFRYLKLIYC